MYGSLYSPCANVVNSHIRKRYLRTNKEAYGVEAYAIYRGVGDLRAARGSGSHYTIFSDFASAVDRVRTDQVGPGKRLAIATHEVSR